MTVRLLSAPTIEPVTLQEVKSHLRIVHDDEDNLLLSYMRAARQYAESTICWRAFIRQELELSLGSFRPVITLPRPPLQEVTSIVYTDRDGNDVTVPTTQYIVDRHSEPGRVMPAPGEQWPVVELYPFNAVQVRYTAGYPTYTGTVDTDDTTRTATRVGGDAFNTEWPPGQLVEIDGSLYRIESVVDEDNVVTVESPGDRTGVPYSANEVPEEIRQGLLLLIGHYYEVREPVVIGTSLMVVPMTVGSLLSPFRAWGSGVA